MTTLFQKGIKTVNTFVQRRKIHGGFFPSVGTYHYDWQNGDERSRIHLRIEPDQNGIILINASRIMHLNPSAVHMAYLFFEDHPNERITNILNQAYGVPIQTLQDDYTQFKENLLELIRPDGACPIHDLNTEIEAPFSSIPSSPYRMDLALSYRCNNDCAHCYNARPRNFEELNTGDWLDILDQLWEIGIPHIVFTGGEPTLRQDLPELIAHAEKNGQITGINTNGRRLSDNNYVNRLVDAGLDHIQITLESHDADTHDQMVKSHGAWRQTVKGIKNAVQSKLFIMTNTTLLMDNYNQLESTLDFLSTLQVPTVGLNALIYSGMGLKVGKGLPESDLPKLLEIARQKTTQYGQKLIWYTPTQYCHFDPVQLELGVKSCTAALYNMCIEPNGDVLPCQSYYQPLGNIRNEPWESIWNHELSIHLRERHYAPKQCSGCDFFSECGGGCPLSISATNPHVIPIQGVF